MEKNQLISALRKNVIQTLNLQDISEADFGSTTPLFGDEGLGLDSVDALELVVMLEKDYKISVDDKVDSKAIFANLETLADYIIANVK